MLITTKGQVTIPQDVREQFGFLPNSEVNFVVRGRKVYLEKIHSKTTRGVSLIKKLRGSGDVKMTTNEILALTRG